MALLINAGSTQILAVHRGPRRGGRRGGFLGCKAVNPAPTCSHKVRFPASREAAAPEHCRATVMLWWTLPRSPARRVCRWQRHFTVFNWLIFKAVCRSVLSQGDAVCSSVEGSAVEFSAAAWLVFLTLFVTADEQRADLLECLTQVLSGLNLKVQ